MATSLQKLIGLRVQAARKRKGLTQEQLAEKIDRTVESVSNVERARTLPTLDTLIRIAKALDLPLTEFFDRSDFAPRAQIKRVEMELRLREMVRALPDRELAIALDQVKALLSASR